MRILLTFSAILAVSVPALPAGAAAGGPLEVDDDGADCPGASYSTIQDAVDAAAALPGVQNIHVCAGYYEENVLVGPNNPIHLEGDGREATVVAARAGTAGPALDLDRAVRVVVRSLGVTGNSALAGDVVTGIRFFETDGEVRDVAVSDIRNASGSAQGVGVRILSGGARTDVTVRDSDFSNITRVGVQANGAGARAHVFENRFIGPELPKQWAPNGVQISRGADGNVDRNEIHDMTSPYPPAGAGSGVLVFCSAPTSVAMNAIFGADLGVSLVDNTGARVQHNEIQDSRFDGVALQAAGTFNCPGGPDPVTDNTVEGNQVEDSAGNGISVTRFSATLPVPSGNRIHANAMHDSGEYDARDFTRGTGTAGTANTWTNNRCETSSPAGLCRK